MARRPRLLCGRWVPALLAAALVTTVAACSADPEDPNSVAAQAKAAGNDNGYVSGDGTIERLATGERGAAIALAGTTLEGRPWTITDHPGKVVVVNVWGSWCPPCIAETPDLQKTWEQLQAKKLPVQFIGIDKNEGPETGLAFQKAHKVTYPSLTYDGGVPLLALQGKATATPTTLVLDKQGRIAARVAGPVTASTLTALVDDVLAEP